MRPSPLQQPSQQTVWSAGVLLAMLSLTTARGDEPPAPPAGSRAAAPEEAEPALLFAREVLPLLRQRCIVCHGADQDDIQGGLDLRTRQGLVRGGESGEPAIVPGKPQQSRLYIAVTRRDKDLVMPPKENDRLQETQVALLRRWIQAGAPWPADADKLATSWSADAGPGAMTVKTSGGLSDDWTNRRYSPEALWGYVPVRRPEIPWSALPQGALRHPVDAFLAAELNAKGLAAAPQADRATLLRRLKRDLTGLPATPAELAEFANDPAADAYERLVDRLLESPHYGERMAQHWLDVVRYADTDGFANDFERPQAWRYRDYVIQAFNRDKPYNRFVVEQIAGDELAPDDPECLIAVGFLRMGPWEQTGMSVAAITRQMWLDDVTNSVGVTFLAQGLACCRCHDHKFDPLPTRDYYSIQAVFAAAEFASSSVPPQPWENLADRDAQLARLRTLAGREAVKALSGAIGDALGRVERKRRDYLTRAEQRYEPMCISVQSRSAPQVAILLGGALDSPGEKVEPGVLSALAGLGSPEPVKIPTSAAGRRLALAQWIARDDHPLTARVMVNRIWQQHFGQGLVASPNNFGATGKRPTHPELLDFLAGWFVEHGWSAKQLHRLIVTSSAYQRSSQHPAPEQVRQLDPHNVLWSRFLPRRLSAEELRDAMLAVTGELNPVGGGPGVFPEINWGVALQPRHIMGGIAPAYVPSLRPQERNRRTIYAFRTRTLADPLLEVFNRPGSDLSCERREETTVTPQVFALLNGQFVHDRALALAIRISRQSDRPDQQIRRAFDLVYGRQPAPEELRACAAHLERMTAHHRQQTPQAVPLPKIVVREMIAEQSGELFRWQEELDLDEYQPDAKPWDVDAATRALADVCLVLLNSNEFVYVY